MTNVATIDLYEVLVDVGVEKDRARKAVDVYLTREEAVKTLATKQDLSEMRDDINRQIRSMIMWVAGLMIGQIAIMTAIMSLFFNAYS